MPILPTPPVAAMLSLALLGASCSLTTDLSGLQRGTGGGGGSSTTTTTSTTTTSTTTTSTTSTSSSTPAVCGDGFIQPGEECDSGSSSSKECEGCVVKCDLDNEVKDPDTYHCYWFDRVNLLDFDAAKVHCMKWREGGHLVTLTSKIELTFVTVTHDADPGMWIGATNTIASGEYQWVTGEPWDYTNWAFSFPKDMGDQQQCVMLGTHSLRWEHAPDNLPMHSICESSPVGKIAP